MTIQQLEYIIALDNHRHFVSAAQSCFVTQPTLTMQVKKLEDEIGTMIFNRKKHPLVPTAAGERIIIKARQILREISQLKALVSTEKESIEGSFKIGVIPTIAPYLIPLFIGDFAKEHPKTKLIIEEMTTNSIIDALKADRLDLGILVTPLEEKQIREIPLFYEPFLVYVSLSHELFEKEKIKPEDIKPEGLWLLNQGHCFRDQSLKICGRELNDLRSDSSNIVYESGSLETLKKLVDRNYGYTLVPELAIDDVEKNKNVRRFADPQPVREVSIVTHHSFAKEVLVDELRKSILAIIPKSYRKNDHFFRVKWR